MTLTRVRAGAADAIGLGLVLLGLLDVLRPGLLLLPTIAAGGDTPCHYPFAVWLQERLLPLGRLHGWYPGAYLGQPALLYYFPFAFVVMAAVAPVTGLPVAFKLGTALGVFLMPLCAWFALRRMRLPFPAPLLGAGATFVFLYLEENPIWGGAIASTLTGEFSYTWATGFALLFLGELVRARQDGRGPWLPGALLALTAVSHGYAVLWAGLAASGLLLLDRRPVRTLGWLAAVAALGFALAAPFLLPLLSGWGWTTPYHDAWIDVSARGLLPALLWPLFALALPGVAVALWRRRGGERALDPLLLLAWGAVAAFSLTAAGGALGVVDVRFAPFGQLSLALCGAAALGVLLAPLALADAAALGLVLLALVHGEGRSRFVRHWVDWNYSGLEAKELWPEFRELNARLRGGIGDPRVSVEYDPLHERAGSLRVPEMLPFFSGRSTLEGLHNQASTTAHPVFYLASELFARSSNPFRGLLYSRFDPESALPRLRLFNVSHVVATSPSLRAFLDGRPDVTRETVVGPYAVYRLRDSGTGYVEPLAFEPVRAEPASWRAASYRWFTRKPANRALLVFSDDPRFELRVADAWAAPPERPLAGGVTARAELAPEAIRVTTDRPGHPLLLKVAYHPRWRAEGALGPYLVSPGLMMIVPTGTEARLLYRGRTAADHAGILLCVAAVAAWVARRGLGRDGVVAGPEELAAARIAARAIPLALALALLALRLVPEHTPPDLLPSLYERASRAYSEERWADAAELARHAAFLATARGDGRRAELLCLQGEALLREGHPREAVLAFAEVADGAPGAHRAQALFSGALARQAAGDAAGAEQWREALRRDHPGTPWVERLQSPAPAP